MTYFSIKLAAKAENQIAYILGDFNQDNPLYVAPVTQEIRDKVLTLAGTDAKTSMLNSADALDALEDANTGMRAELRQVKIMCYVLLLAVFYLVFR